MLWTIAKSSQTAGERSFTDLCITPANFRMDSKLNIIPQFIHSASSLHVPTEHIQIQWLGHVCNVFKGGLPLNPLPSPFTHLRSMRCAFEWFLSPPARRLDSLQSWLFFWRRDVSFPSSVECFERGGWNWVTSHAGACSCHMQTRWTENTGFDSSCVHESCWTPITVGVKASNRR